MTEFSDLKKSLQNGEFIYTGEVEPLKTSDLSGIINEAKKLRGIVTACNVTDNPQAHGYASSLAGAYIIQRDASMEAVYQLTCRDRNILGLLSDILGAAALGIKNILAITGDYTTLGDIPYAKPVFDLDSTRLTHMIDRIRTKGIDPAGNQIKPKPDFFIGVAANPNSVPLEPEIIKLEKKQSAGADFVQTQVVFDIETVERFFDSACNISIPILVGLFPLKTYGIAKFFDLNVPGVNIPKELLGELKDIASIEDKILRRAEYDKVNEKYFTRLIKDIKKTPARGCHIMAVDYASITCRLVKNTR